MHHDTHDTTPFAAPLGRLASAAAAARVALSVAAPVVAATALALALAGCEHSPAQSRHKQASGNPSSYNPLGTYWLPMAFCDGPPNPQSDESSPGSERDASADAPFLTNAKCDSTLWHGQKRWLKSNLPDGWFPREPLEFVLDTRWLSKLNGEDGKIRPLQELDFLPKELKPMLTNNLTPAGALLAWGLWRAIRGSHESGALPSPCQLILDRIAQAQARDGRGRSGEGTAGRPTRTVQLQGVQLVVYAQKWSAAVAGEVARRLQGGLLPGGYSQCRLENPPENIPDRLPTVAETLWTVDNPRSARCLTVADRGCTQLWSYVGASESPHPFRTWAQLQWGKTNVRSVASGPTRSRFRQGKKSPEREALARLPLDYWSGPSTHRKAGLRCPGGMLSNTADSLRPYADWMTATSSTPIALQAWGCDETSGRNSSTQGSCGIESEPGLPAVLLTRSGSEDPRRARTSPVHLVAVPEIPETQPTPSWWKQALALPTPDYLIPVGDYTSADDFRERVTLRDLTTARIKAGLTILGHRTVAADAAAASRLANNLLYARLQPADPMISGNGHRLLDEVPAHKLGHLYRPHYPPRQPVGTPSRPLPDDVVPMGLRAGAWSEQSRNSAKATRAVNLHGSFTVWMLWCLTHAYLPARPDTEAEVSAGFFRSLLGYALPTGEQPNYKGDWNRGSFRPWPWGQPDLLLEDASGDAEMRYAALRRTYTKEPRVLRNALWLWGGLARVLTIATQLKKDDASLVDLAKLWLSFRHAVWRSDAGDKTKPTKAFVEHFVPNATEPDATADPTLTPPLQVLLNAWLKQEAKTSFAGSPITISGELKLHPQNLIDYLGPEPENLPQLADEQVQTVKKWFSKNLSGQDDDPALRAGLPSRPPYSAEGITADMFRSLLRTECYGFADRGLEVVEKVVPGEDDLEPAE